MGKLNKIPKLRFPEFKGEWEDRTLGEIADVKTGPFGSTLHQHDYVESGTPIITVEHLSELGVTHQNLPLVSDKDKLRLKSYNLKKDDLVFSRVGSVDRCSLISQAEDGWLFSGRLLRVRIENQFPVFFNYVFQLEDSKQKVRSIAVGQTMPSINTSILKSIHLNFPKLREQTCIASFFSTIDKKILSLYKKKTLLEQYKMGVMKMIFSQELRFRDEDGKLFPEWTKSKLGNIAEIIGGGTPDTSVGEFWNGGIQWFTPTEIKSDYTTKSQRTITELGLKKSSAKILPVGTILLTSRATIGEVSIAREECTTNQGFQSLVVRTGNSNLYIFNWLKMHKHELIKRANGSTFPEISKSQIELIEIPVPVLDEQTKNANFFQVLDAKILNAHQQIVKIEQWKKGLLQQMFV